MIKVNHIKKTITMDKEYYEKAQQPSSKEFSELAQVINAFPTYAIKKKTSRAITEKDRLTYAEMDKLVEQKDNRHLSAEWNRLRQNKEISFFAKKKWFIENCK